MGGFNVVTGNQSPGIFVLRVLLGESSWLGQGGPGQATRRPYLLQALFLHTEVSQLFLQACHLGLHLPAALLLKLEFVPGILG